MKPEVWAMRTQCGSGRGMHHYLLCDGIDSELGILVAGSRTPRLDIVARFLTTQDFTCGEKELCRYGSGMVRASWNGLSGVISPCNEAPVVSTPMLI